MIKVQIAVKLRYSQAWPGIARYLDPPLRILPSLMAIDPAGLSSKAQDAAATNSKYAVCEED